MGRVNVKGDKGIFKIRRGGGVKCTTGGRDMDMKRAGGREKRGIQWKYETLGLGDDHIKEEIVAGDWDDERRWGKYELLDTWVF